MNLKSFLLASLALSSCALAGVSVSVPASAPSGAQVKIAQPNHDPSGNTSIRFVPKDEHEFKFDTVLQKNYWDRDRDLGQTFRTGSAGYYLTAITLRTGFGTRPFRGGSNGAEMYVQIFKVTGTPVVNTNGTTTHPPGTKWQTFDPARPDTDDFLTGETYTPVRVVRGAFLPQLTDPATDPMGELTAKGKYLRFALTSDDAVYLEPNTTYGFFVGFVASASERALTFANMFVGNYADGHGVRREGSTALPGNYDPSAPGPLADAIFVADINDPVDNQTAKDLTAFDTNLDVRTGDMDFGTMGMPDVCTFRDLTFWIEGSTNMPQPPVPIVTGLQVSAVANPPSGANLRVSQPLGRKGPTSVRFFRLEDVRQIRDSPNPADPVGSKYLTKDRDLGQVFTTPAGAAFRLDAVTLRVGVAPLNNDIAGALNAGVFMQIFDVTGTPTIHDNGTTGTTTVSVSYPSQPMADDYITGESYTTLLVAEGGALPGALQVGQDNTVTPTSSSAGTLLKFDLTATGGVVLQPSRKYAFMVGFRKQSASRALPLDNCDYLNQSSATQLQKETGPYGGGHAIRREGRVPFPESNLRDALENVDANDPQNDALSSFWPDFTQRLQQPPGTWGRPDVDTYRDLVFWIEGTDTTPPPPPPPPPPVEKKTSGISETGTAPTGPFMAEGPASTETTSIRWRNWGDDTDLGALFTNGPETRQFDALTVKTMTISGTGAGVPGMPVIFDFYRVTGNTFTPLWRSTSNIPATFVAGNFLTFHFLSQRQILEANASYAFVIGAGGEEITPTVAQDFFRLVLAITSSNTRPDTYQIRRESEFGSTRPAITTVPNLLYPARGIYFALHGDPIFPQVSSHNRTAGAFEMSVLSLQGGQYIFERSPDLQPPWLSLTTSPGTGGLLNFQDNAPLADKAFYRVRIGP